MKILFKSLCVGIVTALIFTFIPFEVQCREISTKVFRVHILANSDSVQDQSLKLKVRDAVIKKSEELLVLAHSKSEAQEIVSNNLDVFEKTAQDVICKAGFDYPVSARVCNLYFNTRYYDDITMPAGYYDALQISIGEAKGKNWWCVMYPSLCLFAESDNDKLEDKLTTQQYGIVSSNGRFRFRFRVVEVINNIFDLFS